MIFNKMNYPMVNVLTGRKYDSLSFQTRILFCYQGLFIFVTFGYLEDANATMELALMDDEHDILRDNGKRDNKSLVLIQQGLYDTIFPKVSHTSFS